MATQRTRRTHGQQHVPRCLLRPDPRVVGKKEKKGILIPACSNTPAEAKRRQPNQDVSLFEEAAMTMDLLTNPLNKGKAEMEAAPTRGKVAVRGMDL